MRCRACNIRLEESDLLRKAADWDICSDCRYHGSKKYNASEKTYDHSALVGIPLDGSTISIEDYIENEKSQVSV